MVDKFISVVCCVVYGKLQVLRVNTYFRCLLVASKIDEKELLILPKDFRKEDWKRLGSGSIISVQKLHRISQESFFSLVDKDQLRRIQVPRESRKVNFESNGSKTSIFTFNQFKAKLERLADCSLNIVFSEIVVLSELFAEEDRANKKLNDAIIDSVLERNYQKALFLELTKCLVVDADNDTLEDPQEQEQDTSDDADKTTSVTQVEAMQVSEKLVLEAKRVQPVNNELKEQMNNSSEYRQLPEERRASSPAKSNIKLYAKHRSRKPRRSARIQSYSK